MKRTIVVKVMVSKKERTEIKKRIPAGMTLSGYMRWIALRGPSSIPKVQVSDHLE